MSNETLQKAFAWSVLNWNSDLFTLGLDQVY